MKRNARKVMALVMALAMLLSVFAAAEDIGQEIDLGGEIVIEGGLEGETQGEGGNDIQVEEGEQDIELDEGVDAPDGEPELALGEDLDLDLNDLSLDTLEGEALPPETELAMNAGGTWTPWPSTGTPDQPGDYEVTEEVTLSSNWNVPTNDVTRLKLTGAGKITLTGAGKITVPSQANLIIDGDSVGTIDRSDNSNPCIKVNVGGTLTVGGGTISLTSTNAGARVVVNNGTFNMFGGTVNATGGYGVHAVDNSGSIMMSGGTISAEGTGNCNVVYNLGTFIMIGGTINANDSSGIAVYNQGGYNPAAFNMTGGSATINAKSTGVLTRGSNTSFRMSNGTINASNEDGKCVSIQGGTFEMSGGTLNATGQSGMGVEAKNGSFTMTGGTINATGSEGKGVSLLRNNVLDSVSFTMRDGAKINAKNIGVENGNSSISGGTVTMDGGEITGQGVEGSKGVTVYATDTVGSATFTMNGGTVSGFGVGVELKDQSIFNMSAGTIGAQGNGATGVNKIGQLNDFTMSGGTITGFKTGVYNSMGSFKLSGPVNISGNTERDVDLESGTSSRRIAIETGFGSAEPIGVDATGASGSLTGKEITSGFSTAKGSGADPAKFFKSSRSGYVVTLKDGEAVFGEAVTVTFDKNSDAATGTMDPQAIAKDAEAELNAGTFTRRGHRFHGWNTKDDGSGTAYADKAKVSFSADTTLYAVWEQNGATVENPEAQVYTGKAVEPALTVKDQITGEALAAGTDYTARYSDNVKVTTSARAIVTFKGDYVDLPQRMVKFAINPKPITVKAEDKTKVQGEADPVLTYISDDLADGDKLEGALAREAGEKPGTYKITQGDLNNKNYKITFVGATLTITEKKAGPTTAPTTAPEPEGDIETVVKTEADVPEMEIGGLTKAVAADLASKEELARVDAGEKLVVFLTAANIDDTVSATDKALVTATITAKDSGAQVAQYLDFSMYKQVGSDTPTQLTDLKGHKITITITVPNQFRAPAGVKRTFYIVRVHDGEGQIVGSGTGASIKVRTDKFSTYALTYVDEVTPEPEPEPEPVVPDVALLARMTVAGSSKTALKIAWTKIPGADGYDVYFVKCGRDYKSKPKASVTCCSVKISKLTARTEYKAYVRAWMKVGGKKVYLGDSPELHAITGGYDAKYCNAKSVKLNKSAVTLKVGKTTTVKATVKGVKSGRKVLKHVRKVRYYSSNINVATVNKNGKIKATGTGKCTIWAVANNGIRSSVKVTVK